MPFKFNEDGTIATTGEGAKQQPIFISGDGRESPFDVDTTVATISRLNGEAQSHRLAKEAAETKLKAFEGIDDVEAAKKAVETVKSLSVGELKTAAQVKEHMDAATKSANEAMAANSRAAEAREKAKDQTIADLTADRNARIIGGAFVNSKFVKDKLAIPPDIAQKFFGDQFKVVEGGKLVPMDASGNPIFSAVRHGEHADFEEAFPLMVQSYANKEMILKGSGASGGGASSSSGGGGMKSLAQAEFDALPTKERAKKMADGYTVY